MEAYTYKGISAGKYVEGEIEAINSEEASFKLKEQKIIITNLVKSKKKKDEKKAKGSSGGGLLSLLGRKKKSKSRRNINIFKAVCNDGKSRFANFRSAWDVKRSA